MAATDISGRSVASAGDVNGDGFGDLIVGALNADPHGEDSGSSYVVFGKASGFAPTIALSSLDGTNGFRLDGVAYRDHSGHLVASAGDINGDGFADLIVGAPNADPHGEDSGSSYVVFGKASGFARAIALSSLNGTNGFRLDGVAASDNSGVSVASAGDVNGDSFDDLIVGAFGADPHGSQSGSSYVVFGKPSGFAPSIALSSLNGTNGFRLDGVTADDSSGFSVASAGDVDGDGFADLIVGANGADPHGSQSGSSYVVFGRASGFAPAIALSSLNGTNGFRLDGVKADDFNGQSVASADDVNGDGFADLIVGAYGADPHGSQSGSSYVVFGRASGFAPAIALSSLDGTDGFRLDGVKASDNSGISAAAAGDVNGDGFTDLIVGASGADPHGPSSGSSYVVYGKASGFAPAIALSTLDGNSGFRLDGVATPEVSGSFAASAGDFNGDGVTDLIVGAHQASPNGINSGSSYVMFGRGQWSIAPSTVKIAENAGPVQFTIARKTTTIAETVYVSTTQTEGFTNKGDYAGIDNRTLSFAIGEASKPVTIAIRDDALSETDESFGFIVQKNATDPANIHVAQARFSILDNDYGTDSWSIAPNPGSVNEDAGSINFSLKRTSVSAAKTVYVSTTVNKGFANIGDYIGLENLVVSFPAGVSARNVTVKLTADNVPEANETFGLIIQQNPDQPIGTNLTSATFTVLNDDSGTAFTLKANPTGNGQVTSSPGAIACPGICQATFAANQVVKLTATPTQGSDATFVGWGRDCSGTAACTVTMSGARNVTAAFLSPTPPKLQIVSPFLLPSYDPATGSLQIESFLASSNNVRSKAEAWGIVADDTSEAIVIYEATGTGLVTFSASNDLLRGGILTPYSNSFIQNSPDKTRTDTLQVFPAEYNGKSYALALLRVGGVGLIDSIPLTVSQNGTSPQIRRLPIIRPPVVLIHGLWGDYNSLKLLKDYLISTPIPPWNDNRIIPIQYVNYEAFDSFGPRWQLFSSITSAIKALDDEHIVGGRIDVVAHSMGGLVARHFSSQPAYRDWHDRKLGRFRIIITLDTPENGSEVAHFLVKAASWVQLSALSINGFVNTGSAWYAMCKTWSASTTVEQCLKLRGRPLRPDDGRTGAIDALAPGNLHLNKLYLVNPNIPDSRWLAVQSMTSNLNSLKLYLNRFIAETNTDLLLGYSLDGILGNSQNDGIVTASSQINGDNPNPAWQANPLNTAVLTGIGHTGTIPLFDYISDSENVTESPRVHKLVACWLDTAGDPSCRSHAAASPTTKKTIFEQMHPLKLVKKRLLQNHPSGMELSVPVELIVRYQSRNVKSVAVVQRDESGHRIGPQTAELVRSGGMVKVAIAPQLLGTVTFEFWATYTDTTVSNEEFHSVVTTPQSRPGKVRGDINFETILVSQTGGSYQLHPVVRYRQSTTSKDQWGDDISIGDYVNYRLLSAKGPAVVSITANGIISALRPGNAAIEVKFGALSDVVNVVVQPRF